MTGFVVVIPSRFASARLPGKPLRLLAGKPMLEHVYRRGMESGATEVIVATDDTRIADAAIAFGAKVCMTSATHQSGTDRLAEVAAAMSWDERQVIVNLQGDEPLMPAQLIDQCAELLEDPDADVATLASALESTADFANPNVVKVVTDRGGYALYFSRTKIPFDRSGTNATRARSAALHHHGIYAYRNAVLQKIVAADQSALEICEQLEQLRALGLGLKIKVGVPAMRPGPGVDTEADLAAAEQRLRQHLE